MARHDQIANLLNLIRLPALQERAQQRLMLGRCVAHEMDHRQGHLPLFDVDPQRFADGANVADDVENVVLNLKRDAQRQAKRLHLFSGRVIRAAEHGAEQAACPAQHGRLARDDFEIRLLVQIEMIAIVDLQKLAFANQIGRAARSPGWRTANRGWSRGDSCG